MNLLKFTFIFLVCRLQSIVQSERPPPPTDSNYCYEVDPGSPCSYDKVLLWPEGVDRLEIEADFPARFYFVVLFTYNTVLFNSFDQAATLMRVTPDFVTDNLALDYAQAKDINWYMNWVRPESLTLFNSYPSLEPVGTDHTPSERQISFLEQAYSDGYFGSSTIKTKYENEELFYGIFIPCYPMVLGMGKDGSLERDGSLSEVLMYFDAGTQSMIHSKELTKDFRAISPHTTTNRCLSNLFMPGLANALEAVVFASYEEMNLHFSEKISGACNGYEVVIEDAEINEIQAIDSVPVGNRQQLIFGKMSSDKFEVTFPLYEALRQRIGFPPYHFNIWSRLYLVTRVTARSRTNQTDSATKVFEGTFVYSDSPPQAFVDLLHRDGPYTYYTDLRDGLFLTATRSFDRREGRQSDDPLSSFDFSWTCSKKVLTFMDPFQRNYPETDVRVCPTPVPVVDNYMEVYIPFNAIEPEIERIENVMRNTWTVTVTITCRDNPELQASAKKIVRLLHIHRLSVRCVDNCFKHVPYKPMIAEVEDFPGIENFQTWKWYAFTGFNIAELPERQNIYLGQATDLYDLIESQTLQVTGLNTRRLTVLEGSFEWDTRYTLFAEAFYEGNVLYRALGRHIVHVQTQDYEDPPSFTCTFHPQVGYALITEFQVYCINFNYKYTYMYTLDIAETRLYEGPMIPSAMGFILPMVTNTSGESHTVTLNVQKNPLDGFTSPPDTHQYTVQLYSRTGKFLKDIDAAIRTKRVNSMDRIQLLIFVRALEVTLNLTADSMDPEDNRTQALISKYEDKIGNLMPGDSIEDEGDCWQSRTQQFEQNITSKSTDLSYGIDAGKEFESIAEALVTSTCLDTFVRILNVYVNAIEAVILNSVDVLQSNRSTETLDQVTSQNSKWQISGQKLMRLIIDERYMSSLLTKGTCYTAIGQGTSLQVQVFCGPELVLAKQKLTSGLMESNSSDVRLQFHANVDMNLLSISELNTCYYILAMAQETNPYIWARSSLNINLPVFDVTLLYANKSTVKIKNMWDPLDVYFPTPDISSAPAQHRLVTSLPLSEDFKLKVLKLSFHTLAGHELLVKVTSSSHPDVQIYLVPMTIEFKTLSLFFNRVGEFKMGILDKAFSLPNVPESEADPNTVILPSLPLKQRFYGLVVNVTSDMRSSPTSESVTIDLKITAHSLVCMVWNTVNHWWNKNGCKMGPSTVDQVHCLCSRLGIFSGGFHPVTTYIHEVGEIAAIMEVSSVSTPPGTYYIPQNRTHRTKSAIPTAQETVKPYHKGMFGATYDGAIVLSSFWILFIIVAYWAYRKDELTPYWIVMKPVTEVDFQHTFQYAVCLHIGFTAAYQSGTDDKIKIKIIGQSNTSDFMTVNLSKKNCFLHEVERWYLVTTPTSLGDLNQVFVSDNRSFKWIRVIDLFHSKEFTFTKTGQQQLQPESVRSTGQAQPRLDTTDQLDNDLCTGVMYDEISSPLTGFRAWSWFLLQHYYLTISLFMYSPQKVLRRRHHIARQHCSFVMMLAVVFLLKDDIGFHYGSEYSTKFGDFEANLNDVVNGLIGMATSSFLTQLLMMVLRIPELYLEQKGYETETNTSIKIDQIRVHKEGGLRLFEETESVNGKNQQPVIRQYKVSWTVWLISLLVPFPAVVFLYSRLITYSYRDHFHRLVSLCSAFISLVFCVEPVKLVFFALVCGFVFKLPVPAFLPLPFSKEEIRMMKRKNISYKLKMK